jgi:hypothetical protein
VQRTTPPLSIRRLVLAAAASAALCLGATAHADPLVGNGWAAPAPGYAQFNVTVNNPAVAYGGPAGGFIGLFGGNPILFWCYELTQSFGFGVNYDYSATTIADPANAALSELFTEVGGPQNAVQSVLNSTAFQLAVWEIRYESAGPYDLSAGNFRVTDNPTPAAVTLAQHWLDNLPSIQAYTITLLHNDSAQDFVTATPKPPRQQVPEPSPLPLLALGLVAMTLTMRRWNGSQA